MQQLVIQFPLKAASPDESEFQAVIEVEDKLEQVSKGRFELDGHDAGCGEMNIFIITDNARATFEAVKGYLPVSSPWRAGFRDIDSDDYTPLSPPGLTIFEIQ